MTHGSGFGVQGSGGLKAVLRPCVVLVLLLALPMPAWTAPAAAPTKERTVIEQALGHVVAYTKRSLSLEIEHGSDKAEEMLIPFDAKTIKLERLVSLTDLRPGDRVQVTFRQTFRRQDDGTEILVGTVATKISLQSRAAGLQSLGGGR